MQNVTKQSERIEDLEKLLSDSSLRERDNMESLDNLTEELQHLENEVIKWKKIANDKRAIAGEGGDKAGVERAVATAREVDNLKKEINALQGAVRYLREEAAHTRHADVAVSNSWLFEPLIPSAKPGGTHADDVRDADLAAEGRDLLLDLMHLTTTSTVFDLNTATATSTTTSTTTTRSGHRRTRRTPQFHYMRQRENYEALVSWRDSIVARTALHAESREKKVPRRPKGKGYPGTAKLKFELPLAYSWQLKGVKMPEQQIQIVRPDELDMLVGDDGALYGAAVA